MIRILADAKADKEHWLETRKSYLTSSDMYAWRGVGVESWYDKDRDIITRQKFHGYEHPIDDEGRVSMEHGAFDEENIMRKFGECVGSRVEPDNKLFGNDKWPHLAASIDGFVYWPTEEPNLLLAQDSLMVEEVRERLLSGLEPGDACLCEIKKSTSTKWQTEVPPYYPPQLQTQMHILDIDMCVIVAETIKRGKAQKWRQFWDLRAYVVYRDQFWEGILDQVNEDFGKVKEENGSG